MANDNNKSKDKDSAISASERPGDDSNHSPVIYIVDDVQDVLDIVYEMVTAEGYEAKRFSSGRDFLNEPEISPVGCLLLDNQMPGMSGLQVQAELLKRDIDIPIVFMSGESRYDDVVDAVRDGALYFMQKPFTRSELLSHVEEAVAESRKRVQAQDKNARNRALMKTLTGREKQVCQLVTDGLTNKAISEKLNISNGTVEFHRANLMKKLGVKSLADLMEVFRSAEDKGQ